LSRHEYFNLVTATVGSPSQKPQLFLLELWLCLCFWAGQDGWKYTLQLGKTDTRWIVQILLETQ